MEKKQLTLISPFFQFEIDYKNDYVVYIDTSSQKKCHFDFNNTKKTFKSCTSKPQSRNNALSLM